MNSSISLLSPATVTMTSLELVDFINHERADEEAELRHDHFMAKVPRVLGVNLAPRFLGTSHYVNGAGNSVPRAIYVLPKREACLMAMSYSYELQARVYDRMTALEETAGIGLPRTMAQALRLAADQAERLELQQQQLEAAKPAVEFVERYVQADGLKGFREVCKLLKANEARFREFVLSSRIMYRLGRALTAYQSHIDAGRFEVRAGVATASDHAYSTTKFTPKGLAWIAGEWGKYQVTHREHA